jgi:FdhE protein
MTTTGSDLSGLRRVRPEWGPWLAVVEHAVNEAATSAWDAAVPASAEGIAVRPPTVPRLSDSTVSVSATDVRRGLEQLIRIAARSGTPAMATLSSALHGDLDVLTLFEAAVRQDSPRVKQMAARSGADEEAFHAVVALAPLPLLHACNRHWSSSISESWVEGYCPICGAWPAFAEVRGIERSRQFRCGRCGSAWHARALHCPYCAMHDHDALVSLVPEKTGSQAVIDACKNCMGYVKTFTTLQGCPPGTVMLDDLASVALDIAALEQGFSRPRDAGYPLEVTVTDQGAARRFFSWNA